MSKFIELTHKHSGSKFLININKIEAVDVFEGDVIVSLGESEDDFFTVTESYEQVKHLIETGEPLDDGKLYRIQLGDYYIGLSKPDNKIHMGYNSEDNKYYQRIFTLPQIYKLDPRLLPLAVEVIEEDKEY